MLRFRLCFNKSKSVKMSNLKKITSLSFLIGASLVLLPTQESLAARLDVTSITTGPFTDNADSTVGTITYLNQTLPITKVNDGTDNWRVGVNTFSSQLFVRRSGVNSGSGGQTVGASITWSERQVGDNNNTVRGSLPTSTAVTLGGNNLFEGTDNTFANVANSNASDIERLDFVVENGVVAKTSRAVIVAERGSPNIHDGFGIAAITNLGTGINDPLTWEFGELVQVAGTTWGNTDLRNTSQTPPGATNNPYTVLNNSSGNFARTATPNNQNFGAVLITLDELVAVDTKIFGYALFGFDVVPDSSGNLVTDWKDAMKYPIKTQASGQNNQGGIDLVALNAGIARNESIEIPENRSALPILAFGLFGLTAKMFSGKTKKS